MLEPVVFFHFDFEWIILFFWFSLIISVWFCCLHIQLVCTEQSIYLEYFPHSNQGCVILVFPLLLLLFLSNKLWLQNSKLYLNVSNIIRKASHRLCNFYVVCFFYFKIFLCVCWAFHFSDNSVKVWNFCFWLLPHIQYENGSSPQSFSQPVSRASFQISVGGRGSWQSS